MHPRRAWAGTVALLVASTARPAPLPAGQAEDLAVLSRKGMEAYRQGDYHVAIQWFRRGVEESRLRNESARELLFRNALGGGLLSAMNLREASRELQAARRLALQLRDDQAAAAAAFNLSSIHSQSNDLEGAQTYLAEASRLIPNKSPYRAAIHVQQSYLALDMGDARSTEGALALALDVARETGDWQAESLALDIRGHLKLAQRQFGEAERDFLESFRLRRLFLPTLASSSLRSLGRWHFARKRWSEAERLFTAAIADWQRKPSALPLWLLLFDRGVARARQGNWHGALNDYRSALDFVARWRNAGLPAAGARAALDVTISDLTAALAEAGQRIWQNDGDLRGVEIALVGVEMGRSASLREAHLEARARNAALPDTYAERLTAYHRVLAASWGPAGLSETAELRRARFRLNEAEAALPTPVRADSATYLAQGGLAAARRRLGTNRLFFSFLIGEQESLRWVLTRGHLQFDRLPGRAQIESWCQKTRMALANNDVLPPEAERLSAVLFGGLPPDGRKATSWLLSLDGPLFSTPLGALPAPGEPAVRLIDRVSLEIVPSLEFLDFGAESAQGVRLIVADAVYNLADPRAAAPIPGSRGSAAVFRKRSAPDWDLPRLVGSGEECRRISAQWTSSGHPVRTRTGTEINAATLSADLAARPEVIHFATHLAAPRRSVSLPVLLRPPLTATSRFRVADIPDAALLLGLNKDGSPQVIGSTEIAAHSVPGSLVVLSGCEGGSGPVLPGAGLLALARAWIAAGASSVVASLWPIPDHSGEFFERFYQIYDRLPRSRRSRAAEALRQVQAEWRRRPETARQASLWAAFFVMGKE